MKNLFSIRVSGFELPEFRVSIFSTTLAALETHVLLKLASVKIIRKV